MSAQKEKARLLIERGKWELAKRELGEALRENSEDAEAYALLGLCDHSLGNHDEAVELLKKSIGLDPEDSYPYYLLGVVFLNRRDNPLFQEEFYGYADVSIRKALGLFPHSAPYHSILAAVLFNQKEYKQALQTAEKGLSLNPRHDGCLNMRTLALKQLKKSKDVEKNIDQALTVNPENPFAMESKGWLHFSRGEFPQALQCFEDSLRLDPDDLSAQKGFHLSKSALNPRWGWNVRYAEWIRRKMNWLVGMMAGLVMALVLFPRLMENTILLILITGLIGALAVAALAGYFEVILGTSYESYGARKGRPELSRGKKWAGYFFMAVILGLYLAYKITDQGKYMGLMGLLTVVILGWLLFQAWLKSGQRARRQLDFYSYLSIGLGIVLISASVFGMDFKLGGDVQTWAFVAEAAGFGLMGLGVYLRRISLKKKKDNFLK